MEKYPAKKLSGSQVKVLLAVVLTRHLEVFASIAEFAIRSGVEELTIPSALDLLSAHGLIAIIPQTSDESLVPLKKVRTYAEVPEAVVPSKHETTSTVPDGLVLEPEIQGGSGGVVSERANDGALDVIEVDLIDTCRRADESGKRQLQIFPVLAIWQGVFPDHRLLKGTANKWIDQYKSAEFIGGVIEKVGEYNEKTPINHPLSYVEKALAKEFEKKQEEDGPEVTPELVELLKIGVARYGKNGTHQNRSRYQRGVAE